MPLRTINAYKICFKFSKLCMASKINGHQIWLSGKQYHNTLPLKNIRKHSHVLKDLSFLTFLNSRRWGYYKLVLFSLCVAVYGASLIILQDISYAHILINHSRYVARQFKGHWKSITRQQHCLATLCLNRRTFQPIILWPNLSYFRSAGRISVTNCGQTLRTMKQLCALLN